MPTSVPAAGTEEMGPLVVSFAEPDPRSGVDRNLGGCGMLGWPPSLIKTLFETLVADRDRPLRFTNWRVRVERALNGQTDLAHAHR
jgi:hypothetical protein